jgi:GNAT superfamily N-acetyltransferase
MSDRATIALIKIDLADDDGLGRWVAVHNAVDPHPLTVAGYRAETAVAIGHLVLLATVDGQDVGAAECGWSAVSEESRTAFVIAWVLPSARRRGVGSALVDRGIRFALDRGMVYCRSSTVEGDDGALAFAARYGLEVIGGGQVGHLTLTPSHAAAAAALPPGVEMTTLAARPDLVRDLYDLEELVRPEIPTLALEPTPSYDAWHRQLTDDPGFLPELSVTALRDGQVVGTIQVFDNAEGTAFIGLTAVHPDARRLGIARALKVELAARAARDGWRRLETYNDVTNERMRALNEDLGYSYRPRMVSLKGELRRVGGAI